MAVDWDKHVLAPLLKVFGEDVRPIYSPASGTPFEVDGVYDRAYHEVVINDAGVAMNAVSPVVGVRVTQFPTPPGQGDRVLIAANAKAGRPAAIAYVVRNVEPDGHGWALLRLNKVSA